VVVGDVRLEKADAVRIHALFLNPLLRECQPLLLLRVELLLQLCVPLQHGHHLFLQVLYLLDILLFELNDVGLQLCDFEAEELDFLVFVGDESVECVYLLVGDFQLEPQLFDLIVLLLDGIPQVADSFLLLVGTDRKDMLLDFGHLVLQQLVFLSQDLVLLLEQSG